VTVAQAIPIFRLMDTTEARGNSLVEQARRGNRAAFGELYQRYARMVHGILLSRVPPSEVDDLMQDVFLSALKRLASLRSDDAFGGWLAMIARNQSTDYHRRAPKATEITEGHLRQHPPSPEAFAVMDAIRSLPEAYRETLALRLVEGLTGPEIAEQTGLTADSVRVNLHRGMKMLREKLEGRSAHEQ
jgi:RNA polymerase sigma-70 factor (ECF subfamily)